MTFRQISKIALDGVSADLQMKLNEARNRGSDMRAPARPAVGGVGDRPALWEEAMRPVAFAREGTAQTGITGKVATTEAAAELNREDVKQRSEARWTAISASLHRMRRDMATVRNGAEPHGSTVVISMCIRAVHARTKSAGAV